MKLFDSHCHLQFPQYDADREEVLARMRERAVGALVVGTDITTSRAGLELVKQHDFLWASVGLHPNDSQEWIDISIQMEELARNSKVVAIGECGLDYFRTGKTAEERTAQRKRFEKHIALANEVGKALIVHCRDAHDDCSSILQNTRIDVPVIIHFFTGSEELAKRYLELGCYLSFPGPVTYTDMYDESICVTPLERLLIETDAPFAAPMPHRGKRNEPAYVEEVARKVASLKGTSLEEVSLQSAANAKAIFGL